MGPCGNEGANAHCHCARFIQRLDVLQFITQVTVFFSQEQPVWTSSTSEIHSTVLLVLVHIK